MNLTYWTIYTINNRHNKKYRMLGWNRVLYRVIVINFLYFNKLILKGTVILKINSKKRHVY